MANSSAVSHGGAHGAAASPSPPPGAAGTSPALAALRNGTLGVGFSGSGFLILYFTGVTAVLQQLGVINNRTRLAGSSGGAINAALSCAGVPTARQYAANFATAVKCRPSRGCQGFLDSVVRTHAGAVLPADAGRACSGRLFVQVTEAFPRGKPDTARLLGPGWAGSGTAAQQHARLMDALAASSFIPTVSGPSAAVKVTPPGSATKPIAAYDGSFTNDLPCPPGVSFCVAVSAQTPNAAKPGLQSLLGGVNQGLQQIEAAGNGTSGAFLPLNPVPEPQPAPVIYPGVSGALLLRPQDWNQQTLTIGSNDTLAYLFEQGRLDAAAWAVAAGVADSERAVSALAATALCRTR